MWLLLGVELRLLVVEVAVGSLAYIALFAAEEEEVVDEPVVTDGDERCGCCCCCNERFLEVRVLPPPELPPLPVPPPRSLDCDLDLLPESSSS